MGKRIVLYDEDLDALKDRVRVRDGKKCRKCKAAAHTVHHIIFRSDLHLDTSANMCVLCTLCHDAVHGKIKTFFLVITNPSSDLIPPDADKGLKFKSYNTVQRRIRWRL